MLIYLTDSLMSVSPHEIINVKKCIRNLCISYEESKHLLLGDYKVLEWAFNIITDESSRIVLNKLIQEFSISPIPSQITEYTQVGNWSEKTKINCNGILIHKVPYSFFTDTNNCQKANVIVEDENDYGIYNQILKWYNKDFNFFYNLKCIHGGGTNMDRTISTTLNDSKIALSFVDTDIRFPGDKIKKDSTCGKCKKIAHKVENSAIFNLQVLNVHEIENLLPFDIVLKLDWNQENLKQFKYLLSSDINGNIMKYFDIKKGIRKNKDLVESDAFFQFAKYCYECNPELSKDLDFLTKYTNTEEDDILYLGLGNPLKKTIEYFNCHEITTETFTLLPFQENEWKIIAQNLLNYGLSRSRESLN